MRHHPFSYILLPSVLVLTAALSGCTTTPPPKVQPPAPAKIYVDYRNGWFHKATGTESIATLGERYKRDPNLMADINQQSGPYAVPDAGTMLYIPPSNDREQVRAVLFRLQGHPELIPKTPWDPTTGAPSTVPAAETAVASSAAPGATPTPAPSPTPRPVLPAATVSATPTATPTPEAKPPVQAATAAPDAAQPANPLQPRAQASNLTHVASPSRGEVKETVIAEAKPKRRLLSWLLGDPTTRGEEKKPIKRVSHQPRPAPMPAPAPARTAGSSSTSFLWPVKGQVVMGYKSGWRQPCHGIEVAAAEGTPVRAARGGTVLLAQAYPGYGNLVLIDHGNGYTTSYGYTRQMLVREGQKIERGQTIASVGRLTQGSESRLLFQVRRNALPIDPIPLLKDQ